MLPLQKPSIALLRARHLNLTTFRKSGEGVSTPVWFVAHNGTLYIRIHPQKGKVKRVRHTKRVTVAPCTMQGKTTGEECAGNARLISDGEEMECAETLLSRKYGLIRRLYFPWMRMLRTIRRQPQVIGRAYLAIEFV